MSLTISLSPHFLSSLNCCLLKNAIMKKKEKTVTTGMWTINTNLATSHLILVKLFLHMLSLYSLPCVLPTTFQI